MNPTIIEQQLNTAKQEIISLKKRVKDIEAFCMTVQDAVKAIIPETEDYAE